MPYSDDLRAKLVLAWQSGEHTQAELADLFHVSLSWVEEVLRRWRQTGETAARAYRHGPLPTVQPQRLTRLVERYPDATLAELGQRLHVQPSTICRWLQKLKLPRKKRRCMPANATRRALKPCAGIGARAAVVGTQAD